MAGALLCLGLARDPAAGQALAWIISLFLMIAATWFAPAVVGGIGLLRDAWWGRLLIGGLSFLLLPVLPVGTALGGFGLWVLFRAGPPTGAGRTPRRPWPNGFLLSAAGVASGFVVFLGAGFRISGDAAPAGLSTLFWPALAVLLLCLGAGVVAAVRRVRERAELVQVRANMDGRHEAWKVAHARRIATLAADPVRAPYAERVRRNEAWSDEQIDYDLDPSQLTTCAHLQPIERALRDAGVTVKLYMAGYVQAQCVIDQARLQARFAPPPCVHYREYYESERGGAPDFPMAQLACSQHPSVITTVHPGEARRGVGRFPD